MTARKILLVLAGALGGVQCSAFHARILPAPVSPVLPSPTLKAFRAGVGRADITPPPGVGLSGSGPEGRRSVGYRLRLYARAMVLEDKSGERIGFVVTDLPHMSPNLHRLVAERVLDSTGLGADRLILASTHSHSAPGHFYAERQYNQNTARLAGYEPRMVDFLVTRISAAVLQAYGSMAPARIAWDTTTIVGATRNRSFEAHCRNGADRADICRTPTVEYATTHAVDTVLIMLRVDSASSDPAVKETRPIGALSVFAVHGTVNPTTNTLLDADVHGIVERRLEQYIESLWPAPPSSSRPRAVHLFANGAMGDASPTWDSTSRCPLAAPRRVDSLPIPRGPRGTWDFVDPAPRVAEACLRQADRDLERVGSQISQAAIGLFKRLGNSLRDTASIRRAFRTVWLPGLSGLCSRPVIGAGAAAGAEDEPTRVRGWRWLFWPLLPLGVEEGGSAIQVREGNCQSPKRELLDPLQSRFVVGEHGFPETAQISVVRIGSLVIATAPAEPTTVVGARWRREIEAGARMAGWKPKAIGIISHANGFLQYVATAEEYALQNYEGGSDLYGPGTARVLGEQLRDLARSIPPLGGGASPIAQVAPITAYPGAPRDILPIPSLPPAGARAVIQKLDCSGGIVTVHWIDATPDVWDISRGLRISFQGSDASGRPVATQADDDASVEVRLDGGPTHGMQKWTARWRKAPAVVAGTVTLLRGLGLPAGGETKPFACK
jgi:neutral ceramidase